MYTAGDRVVIEFPDGEREAAVIKSVVNGRVYYVDGCLYCGPGEYEGGHRVGMCGSRIVGRHTKVPLTR